MFMPARDEKGTEEQKRANHAGRQQVKPSARTDERGFEAKPTPEASAFNTDFSALRTGDVF
jgi:hypothetical protein